MDKEREELYINLVESSNKKIDKVEQVFFDARSRNLEHLRTFWINLIIISSTIIVGALTLSFKQSVSPIIILFIIVGSCLFVLMDIVGVFYLNHALSKENKDLEKLHDFYKDNIKKEQEIINEYLKEERKLNDIYNKHLKFLKDVAQKEAEIREKGKENWVYKKLNKYISDILTILFIFGIIFIALSFILLCI